MLYLKPALQALLPAWRGDDGATVSEINDLLRASRETAELLLEDEQLGAALERLLDQQEILGREWLDRPTTFAVQFARAAAHYDLPLVATQHAFAYSWLDNQVAAATKLIPLGQTQAQAVLLAMLPAIPPAVAAANARPRSEWGFSLPGLALASARHETQYTRLFRS